MHAYIAPYARGHGLARMLTIGVEERARELGYHVLNLDVRETQEAAIRLYESLGFVRWGVHPDYALVRGRRARLLLLQAAAPPSARKARAVIAGRLTLYSGDRPEGRRSACGCGAARWTRRRCIRPTPPLRRAPGRTPASPGCTWST